MSTDRSVPDQSAPDQSVPDQSVPDQSVPLDYLPAADGFLEPGREGDTDPAAARAVVIPFGLEASVSYGSGTAAGPRAILQASHQLELFDDELWCEPYRDFGIATVRPVDIPARIEDALGVLSRQVAGVLETGRFPLVLGGEHALTPGAVRAFAARFDDLAVLHIDAHADLRDGYLGEKFSHAAAMRRVLDLGNVTLVSAGIRSISAAEVDFLEANRSRIQMHWAADQARWDVDEITRPLKGRPVYVTFDIDALDAGVMPATGTPEPGGLSFQMALRLLRAAARSGRIVGADIVELAPITGLHACDFTAAKLAYKLLSYALRGTERGSGAPTPRS